MCITYPCLLPRALGRPADRSLEGMFDFFLRIVKLYVSILECNSLNVSKESTAAQVLKRHGVVSDALLKALQSVRGNQRVTDQNPVDKDQALERYARDLTEMARRGKLAPVIGRNEEIRRVVQVLSRRTKEQPGTHR